MVPQSSDFRKQYAPPRRDIKNARPTVAGLVVRILGLRGSKIPWGRASHIHSETAIDSHISEDGVNSLILNR